jgi:uncharacterized protein YbaR (Trm112 family)
MFVELIESLRCPREHEESALVASATRTESRHIVEGTLGCPVCGAEFPITNGVARFAAPARRAHLEPPSAEMAMRLAAFLELTDARGFALLSGRWCSHADQIRRITETPLLLVNAPHDVVADVAGSIETRDAVPLAAGSARAAAIDDTLSASEVAAIVRAIRSQGRLVGPAGAAVPEGVVELVRDDHLWVGEKATAPGEVPRLVRLERSPR